MANAKYSKSTGGIYPTAVYTTFPEDALDIPDDLYTRYLNAEISGFDVVDGVVVEYVPPAPNPDIVRIAEIDAELIANDLKMIRPSASISAATVAGMDVMDSDKNRLMQLIDANEALREERRTLTGD